MDDKTQDTQPEQSSIPQPPAPSDIDQATPITAIYSHEHSYEIVPKKKRKVPKFLKVVIAVVALLVIAWVILQLVTYWAIPRITPPAGWVKISSAPLAYESPTRESTTAGGAHPMIILVATKVSSESVKSFNLQGYVDYALELTAKAYPNFTKINSSNIVVDGKPAKLVTYTGDIAHGKNITTEIFFMINNDVIYNVSGTSLTSTWPKHSSEINQSLLTFVPGGLY